MQVLLLDLEDPHVELLLLHQCLSCCTIVHILHTVPPHLLSNFSDYDNLLCLSLSHAVHHFLSDLTWQQATLPLCLGGLGIRRASDMVYVAYIGSCLDIKPKFAAYCPSSGTETLC